MIVPKGQKYHLNRTFKPGENVPDSLLNERTKTKWELLTGKNKAPAKPEAPKPGKQELKK